MVGEVVSIFQRGRKWYANFQLGSRQHRPSLRTESKKEARRRAIQLEAEIIEGRYRRVPPPPPLVSVIEDYKKFLQTEGRAKRTKGKYHKVLERLLDLAGRRHLSSINDVNLKLMDAFRSERVEGGAGAKTVYGESTIIRQLVNFALSRALITTDPLKGFRMKKPKPTPQPCWTPAQVELILTKAREFEQLQLTVLADTGMRVGELKYLTHADIDFDRNVLHVRPKEDWQPKSGDQRSIPMTPRVRAIVEKLPRRSRWLFCARPSPKYPKGDHQISERHLLTSLKRVLKKVGLSGHLHTFRHAFISAALTRGIPEAIVRTWVGHVDAEVIKLYTHIADESSQEAMRRLTSGQQSGQQTAAGTSPQG